MAATSLGQAFLRLLGCCLAAASASAHRLGDETPVALLQTWSFVQRSSVPSAFFEEPAAHAGRPAWRSSETERDLDRSGPGQPASFDVGGDAVPLPPELRRDDAELGAERPGKVPLSLAESGTRVPAPGIAARERQASSDLPSGTEPPSTLLEREDRAGRSDAAKRLDGPTLPVKPLLILATEPPLAAGAEADTAGTAMMPLPRHQETDASEASPAAANRDVDDAETQDTAARFFECEGEVGRTDCTDVK